MNFVFWTRSYVGVEDKELKKYRSGFAENEEQVAPCICSPYKESKNNFEYIFLNECLNLQNCGLFVLSLGLTVVDLGFGCQNHV